MICREPPRTRTNQLFHHLNLLKLCDVTSLQQSIFMYKCINRLLPSKFCDVFEFKYEIYNYGSGFTTDLHFPKHRTFAFQHNIRISGPKLWNELKDSMKEHLRL